MATKYSRQLLRVSVAQICQNLGWHSTHSTSLEVLTDVLERYILDMGKMSHQYAEQYGRTQVNLNDLGLAFRHMGVSLTELEDYVKHVDSLPFAHDVLAFPAPKQNNLGFPNQRSREIYQREEHIHNHLPYIYPGMEDEVEEEATTPEHPGNTTPVSTPSTQENTGTENVSTVENSPVIRPEKAGLNSPTEGPPYKRQRISNNNLPEEAGHSQYEMTSVKMSHTGLLTPTRGQGKLPDSSRPPQVFRQTTREAQSKDSSKPLMSSDGEKNLAKLEDKENMTERKEKDADKDGSKTNEAVRSSSQKEISAKLLKKAPTLNRKISKKVSSRAARQSRAKTPARAKLPKVSATVTTVHPQPPPPPPPPPAAAAVTPAVVVAPPVPPPSIPSLLQPASAGSRLKELLLDTKLDNDRKSGTKHAAKLVSPKAKEVPKVCMEMQSVPLDLSKPSTMPVKDDDNSSRDDSPERLVIAESEIRPKEKDLSSENDKLRLAAIEESIDSVIRKSLAELDSRVREVCGNEVAGVKKVPVVLKKKAKEKSKSSTSESISGCIDAVLRMSAEVSSVLAAQETVSPTTVTKIAKKKPEKKKPGTKDPSKKQKKLKLKALKGKDKDSKKVREKLKEKINSKRQRQSSSGSEKTPPVRPEKFTPEEWKIYDFSESPPGSPSSSPVHYPSPLRTGSSPKSSRAVTRNTESQAPLLAAAMAATTASLSPAPTLPPVSLPPSLSAQLSSSSYSMEFPPLKPLKIGLAKDSEKRKLKLKEKSKDKEHKKKDKKKDKEKKKKNKDKEKDVKKVKDREKHKETKEEKIKIIQDNPPAVPKIKLNIRLGATPMTTVPQDSKKSLKKERAPVPILNQPAVNIKQESMSPTPLRPEIPKLVIKPPLPPPIISTAQPAVEPMKVPPARLPSPLAKQLTSPLAKQPTSPSAPLPHLDIKPVIPSPHPILTPLIVPKPPMSASKMEPKPILPPVLVPPLSKKHATPPPPSSPPHPPTPPASVQPLPLSRKAQSPAPVVTPSMLSGPNDEPSPAELPLQITSPLGKRTVQRTVFAETVGTFVDETGQKIWICPACKLPDDGSPMIGCDICDDWYHWPCVNIKEEPPSEESWYCPKCITTPKTKPKRKRRRKAKAY